MPKEQPGRWIARYAFLCDSTGKTLCGSDGVLRLDGRFGRDRALAAIRDYRAKFKMHFRAKHDFWTHVFLAETIRDANPTILLAIDE